MANIRPISTDELDRIKARAAEGVSLRVVAKEFGRCRKFLINNGVVSSARIGPAQITEYPAELVEQVRDLITNHARTGLEVCAALDIGKGKLYRIQKMYGIRSLTPGERAEIRNPKQPKPKRKNFIHRLKGYQPQVATTDIEVAVDKLRRRVFVFAESTLKYPSQTPHRYCEQTLFRVGSLHNVPASTVLEMAGQV